MTLFFLLLLHLQVADSKLLDCHSCAPHPSQIHWLPPTSPPCLHAGQPIFFWSTEKECPRSPAVYSDQISVDATGLVFAKQRLCFYFGFEYIEYSYECDGVRLRAKFKLGHPVFSKQRRFKRWLRRRNLDSNTILFQQERYIKELPESATPGTLVATVKATHATQQPIYYSLAAPQDSRSQNVFTLDTISGEIRLAKSLDREMLDKHVLKVTAYERLEPTVSSSATVIIIVLDVQDNSPVFERDSYFADIREDAPMGTTVLSVFARDLDDGPNGEIAYSLGEGDGRELLSINVKSGVVQTAAPLDRETLSLIRLDVIAKDNGDPPRSSSAVMEIGITDVNDNAPVFEQMLYNISVMENTTLPVTIARLKATDKDSGVNGEVHYSLVATSSLPLTINHSTGEVVLRGRLDARGSPFSVLVRAKDGAQPALSTTVSMVLHVFDINDHVPKFIASQKKIFVEENLAAGGEVGRVYAIDEDSGDNGAVRYFLNGSLDFSIDPESGVIRTTTALDRERTPLYVLRVTASDNGDPPLSSSSEIAVVVKDVNDNGPEFPQLEYNITLSEETPRGSQIIVLKAEDKDAEQKIVYHIEQTDKDVVALIDLGEQGALLTLSGQLSSTDQIIRLVISATDQGGLQGKCSVNLYVEDVNSPPYFTDPLFAVRVPEDAPIGYHVTIIKAEDADRGNNAYLTYSIDSQEFAIDNETGLVTLRGALDRETISSYVVAVTVSDGAQTPLNATTQLEIIVDDVNDNAPEFSTQNYTVSIPEDIPVGTSFMQVSAIDLDSGSNGIVDYFLNDSNSSAVYDLFRLDRTSGTLRINSKLDREEHPFIELGILARDRGHPPLSSNSLITIALIDVNDNAPRFEQASYDLYIAENSPVGSVVGIIMATDPDEGENAKMHFRIFGGADAKLFDLEVDDARSGVAKILARSVFDHEAKVNKFSIEVQATSGQLSSTAIVRIHVTDVNDHPPVLQDFILLNNRFQTDESIDQIGIVPAFDRDQNATLEYWMEENPLLTVDRSTGGMFLRRQWRRNFDIHLRTCVSDGLNSVCANCRLIQVYFTEQILQEAVTGFLPKISLDDFWDRDVFAVFRQSLASLGSWKERGIYIVGAYRAVNGVEVNLAVSDGGAIVRSATVKEVLRSKVRQLEQLSRMRMEVVRDISCASEPCSYYQKCREILQHVDAVEIHQTDNFVARTLKTMKSFVCECPVGFASSVDQPGQCDLRVDQCYTDPCRNNATCHPLENGYRCECKPGWRGQSCEIPDSKPTCAPWYCKGDAVCEFVHGNAICNHCKYAKTDVDERCRLLSLQFDGNGLVNINQQLGRIEWELTFRLATIARDGVVLFSGDRNADFIEISIQDRVLRAEFSLGGTSSMVARMENERKNRVNDGEWHTVRVVYYDRRLTLLLDDCDAFVSLHAHGAAPCAAQSRFDLPPKCLDQSVSCFRFLDLYNGVFLGGRPTPFGKIEEGFNGCIANLTLNGQLIEFSSLTEMDVRGSVTEGCPHRQDFCSSGVCTPDARCHNRWDGANCHCPHSTNRNGSCAVELVSPHRRSFTLTDEESFVSYRLKGISVPFTLSLEFRTSRSDLQVVVVEFEKGSTYFKLEIDDGLPRVWLDENSVLMDAPEMHPGAWTKVELEFREEEARTTIDGIYSVTIKQAIFDMALDVVYAGLAPSTRHPSRFDGCLRDVSLNGETLKVSEKGKVRQGCVVANHCTVDGVCPAESTCHREWNRHSCKCHKGLVGDTCQEICSIPGICGSNGYCLLTNASRGYDCHCESGLVGPNCERPAAAQICPYGYWGQFPYCKKCACAEGFQKQCRKNSGECICPKFQFPLHGRCVSCECGYGAKSLQCSVDGQCQCNGQASGRRCDRCVTDHHILDPKTLKCLSLRDRCPSQIEYAIQWPTTSKKSTAQMSCPGTQTGVATRSCDEKGRWLDVNSYNCTRPEYAIMASESNTRNSVQLMKMLRNATHGSDPIEGRNLDIARSVLHTVIDKELRLAQLEQNYVKDLWFMESLTLTAGRILAHESSTEYLLTVRKLTDYAAAVFSVQQQLPYLEPFQFSFEQIVRAATSHIMTKDLMIDWIKTCLFHKSDAHEFYPILDSWPFFRDINFIEKSVTEAFGAPTNNSGHYSKFHGTSRTFPFFAVEELKHSHKFNRSIHIKDQRTNDLPTVFIHVVNTSRVLYSILSNPRCSGCEAPLVIVVANSSAPLRVKFVLNERHRWRYPECVHLAEDSSWSTHGSRIIELSRSHVGCEFSSGTVFTVISKTDSGSFMRISQTTSTAAPVMASVAMVLCLIAFVLSLTKVSTTARPTRLGFIVTFILNAFNLYFVNRITLNEEYCPARNAVLVFTSCAPFAWLFLSAFQLWRMLCEGGSKRCSPKLYLVIGVVVPGAVSCATYFVTSCCSIDPHHRLLWMIVLPIGVIVVLSLYVTGTSLVTSMNKQFDVVVVKFHLRRAICQHFLLTALVLLHTVVVVSSPMLNISNPLKELISNITLVVTTLFILIWVVCPGGSHTPNTTATMWLDASQKSNMAESAAVGCESPLLTEEPVGEEWGTEPVPADPFLTSTPTREFFDSRDRENPVVKAILSPADKILSDGLGHVYGNMSPAMRFRTEQDDADDAYYTYTASRRYKQKQSTFINN